MAMRTLFLATVLFVSAAAPALGAVDDIPPPPPPPANQSWVTGSDMVRDCQHPSPQNKLDCHIAVLLQIVLERQNEPGKLCTPTIPHGLGDDEETRQFQEKLVSPAVDWVASHPDALKDEWEKSVYLAAQALWPCP